MKIEKALTSDAKELSELTMRSKAHWKYSAEQMEIWREDLRLTEADLLNKEVYKLAEGSELIGYYSFLGINELDVKLENLFVEPKFIGKGYGKLLMSDFLERLQQTRFERILLDADPNAEEFYAHLGFKVIGKLETSIKNRFLPIMERRVR